MKDTINIIWFKKDLRITDNQCLFEYETSLPTIAVYFFESDIIRQSDFSDFHLQFIVSSLIHLESSLKKIGIQLLYIPLNAVDGLEYIGKYYSIKKIFAHEETGNLKSFERDKDVIHYTNKNNIKFIEYPTNGVVRRLKSRDSWNKIWKSRMSHQIYEAKKTTCDFELISEFSSNSKNCRKYYKHLFETIAQQRNLQKGGEELGKSILKNFLSTRSSSYMYNISKPFESQSTCSRLSPYITYGCLSVKYVFKETQKRMFELGQLRSTAAQNHIKSLEYFLSRLHWQSHFIQKLEDEPEMEIKNLNPDFNSIRNDTDTGLIDAVFSARSGIPYIDATVRELQITGWTNFRSRATLVSFLCNTCMQPWQSVASKIAQLFTDYEPGIHYPQIQMQAATTGINTIRIYNPVYNGKQKDIFGKFIYQYLPELRTVPIDFIHEPHLWDLFETLEYPHPIIDIKQANKEAKDILWKIKGNTSKETKNKIIKKHASRTFHSDRKNNTSSKKKHTSENNQTTLF
ncbi:hypothetical protein GW846_05720 [Candidatus Gracilibacteria bacterium]|nr:hypothetical protein [Candidatus Gracilibacteria bacterium]